MAEILIKAREPWQITDTGSRKGDIIVVRPDGWKWGKEECLPNFIIAKVDGTMEQNQHLEEHLYKDGVMDKYRKNAVDKTAVDAMEAIVKDYVEVKPITLTSKITAKTVSAVSP